MTLLRILRLLSLAAGLAGAAALAAADTPAPAASPVADWSVQAAEHPVTPGSKIMETVWEMPRPPGGAWDKIALHRYRGPGQTFATLLYLPGTNMNGVTRLTDESHNLWLFLAARGVTVYALDYRTHFVPPETPATGLDAMKTWDTAAFVGDITAAAALARKDSGQDKLFVAGFSRGVFLTYAYADSEPDHVAGLVLLDGPFKGYAPKNEFDAGAALAKLEAAHEWGSDIAGSMGYDARQKLMDAVAANPNAPASDPSYKTLGDQLAHVLQNAWGNGGLANPLGGLSKPQVLAKLLGGYDRYYPTAQDVDGKSIADHTDDPRTTLDDNWGKLTMPVLLFSNTNMGVDWMLNAIYSAGHSGSKDVTINVLERYGHLDVLVSETARHDVYEPTFAWLRAHTTAAK